MKEDPFHGRDARTRLLSERQTFDRIEPTTRRALLAIAVITLGMGAVSLLNPKPVAIFSKAGAAPYTPSATH
jgi:hypothetical protein